MRQDAAFQDFLYAMGEICRQCSTAELPYVSGSMIAQHGNRLLKRWYGSMTLECSLERNAVDG